MNKVVTAIANLKASFILSGMTEVDAESKIKTFGQSGGRCFLEALNGSNEKLIDYVNGSDLLTVDEKANFINTLS